MKVNNDVKSGLGFLASSVSRLTNIGTRQISKVAHWGNKRVCPVCGKHSRVFMKFGYNPRDDAQCPYCHSLERHRLIWLFLQRRTRFFSDKYDRVLHVAPETCFEKRFKSVLKSAYLTADLNNPSAMIKMDVTNIKYPDNTFDVIMCNHVLEHVPDDKKAMKAFYRVLKPDGWAIITVPIVSDMTYEDDSVVSPNDRLKIYGHPEHVRNYGHDYMDRLREAGFTVNGFRKSEFIGADEVEKFGLSAYDSQVVYCQK